MNNQENFDYSAFCSEIVSDLEALRSDTFHKFPEYVRFTEENQEPVYYTKSTSQTIKHMYTKSIEVCIHGGYYDGRTNTYSIWVKDGRNLRNELTNLSLEAALKAADKLIGHK